jgi:hypothetical protein
MPARSKFSIRGAGGRGQVVISGSITLTAAGAISSLDGFATKTTAGGQSTIKTAGKTARYTVTLDRAYKKLRFLGAPGLVGPADAAFGNVNANAAQFRNRSAGSGATQASFDIQLFLASSGADTDGASGTEIHWAVVAQEQ